MAVNDKITVNEYNNIRSKVVNVLGAGSSNSGYGQTVISSAVAEGNTVSVNEWGKLRFDIINAYTHIYGSAPSTVQVYEGNTVRYSTVDAPVSTYDTLANTIVANRFTVHSSQSSTGAIPSTSTTWPGPYGSTWRSRIQCPVTVSFPSANAARYFFNSGGEIRFAASRSGGSSTAQNTQWTSILSAAGTQTFGGNIPTAGLGTMNGQNWYRLTGSDQVWYSRSGSSPYASNTYRINARSNVSDNSTGSATAGYFLLEFIDNYTDPDGGSNIYGPYDDVDGTFTVSVSYLYATGILVPTGTGNFTVTQPTVTLGTIAP